MSSEKFAARLGVKCPTINRGENGKAKPSPLGLKQIEYLLKDIGKPGSDLIEEYFSKDF